jgi:hypothetical protein
MAYTFGWVAGREAWQEDDRVIRTPLETVEGDSPVCGMTCIGSAAVFCSGKQRYLVGLMRECRGRWRIPLRERGLRPHKPIFHCRSLRRGR